MARPPLSYSDMIARQSAIIAEQDNSYSCRRRITSNSRVTFRRVDHTSASSSVSQYQQQNPPVGNGNNSNSSKSITEDINRSKSSIEARLARQTPYPTYTGRVSMPLIGDNQHENGTIPFLSPETYQTKYVELNKGQLPYSAVAKGTSIAIANEALIIAPVAPEQDVLTANETERSNKQPWQVDMLFSREPLEPCPDRERVLKTPSHHWTPPPPGICNNATCNNQCNHVCNVSCVEACEKKQPVNGLLQTLEKHLAAKEDDSILQSDSSQIPSCRRSRNGGTSQANVDKLELLRAAVENAARAGFMEHTSRQRPNTSWNFPDFPSQSQSPNGPRLLRGRQPPPASPPQAERRPIPFNHDHRHCKNWLNTLAQPKSANEDQNVLQFGHERSHVNMCPTRNQLPKDYSPAVFSGSKAAGIHRDATHDEYRLPMSLRGGGTESSLDGTDVSDVSETAENSKVTEGSEAAEDNEELEDAYAIEDVEFSEFDVSQDTTIVGEDLELGSILVQLSSLQCDEPCALDQYDGEAPNCSYDRDLSVPKTLSAEVSEARLGSWSSSYSWVVDKEKEKGRWTKLQARLRFAGMDRSPFVPKSFAEYLYFKVEAVEREVAEKKTELEAMESEWELLRKYVAMGGDVDDVVSAQDEESTVASNSKTLDELWPSVRQLKIFGDETARCGFKRGLPPKDSLNRL